MFFCPPKFANHFCRFAQYLIIYVCQVTIEPTANSSNNQLQVQVYSIYTCVLAFVFPAHHHPIPLLLLRFLFAICQFSGLFAYLL